MSAWVRCCAGRRRRRARVHRAAGRSCRRCRDRRRLRPSRRELTPRARTSTPQAASERASSGAVESRDLSSEPLRDAADEVLDPDRPAACRHVRVADRAGSSEGRLEARGVVAHDHAFPRPGVDCYVTFVNEAGTVRPAQRIGSAHDHRRSDFQPGLLSGVGVDVPEQRAGRSRSWQEIRCEAEGLDHVRRIGKRLLIERDRLRGHGEVDGELTCEQVGEIVAVVGPVPHPVCVRGYALAQPGDPGWRIDGAELVARDGEYLGAGQAASFIHGGETRVRLDPGYGVVERPVLRVERNADEADLCDGQGLDPRILELADDIAHEGCEPLPERRHAPQVDPKAVDRRGSFGGSNPRRRDRPAIAVIDDGLEARRSEVESEQLGHALLALTTSMKATA